MRVLWISRSLGVFRQRPLQLGKPGRLVYSAPRKDVVGGPVERRFAVGLDVRFFGS